MPHPSRVRPFVMLAVALLLMATPLAALAAESITWAVKTPMPTPRLTLSVVAQGGDIYAIGGSNGSNSLATVERYTPATDSWQSRASLPQALEGAAAVAASNGRIYVFGGYSSYVGRVDNVYYYTPADNLWSSGENEMPTARAYATAAEVDGKVYVIGGFTPSGYTGVNEVFNLADGTWSTAADLPEPRSHVGSVAVGTKVYVIGGYSGAYGSFDRVDIYDTVTDTWSQGAPMPIVAVSFGIALVNNRIYVIGGNHETGDWVILNNVQEYDIATNTWSQANPISVPRDSLGAAVVGGKIYAIGGYEEEELGQAQVGASPARRGLISAEGVQAQARVGLNEEGTFVGQAPPPEVPEPATIMLLASGLLGMGGFGVLSARMRARSKR